VPDHARPDGPPFDGLRVAQELLQPPVLEDGVAGLVEPLPELRHLLPEAIVLTGDAHQGDVPVPHAGKAAAQEVRGGVNRTKEGDPGGAHRLGPLQGGGRADEDLNRRDEERHGNEDPPPIPEEGSHRYRLETGRG